MKRFSLLMAIGMYLLFGFNVFSQEYKHQLTEKERKLMPEYLNSLNTKSTYSAPTGNIQPVAEFAPAQGVLVAYPFGIPVSLIAEMSQDIMVTTIVSGSSQENQVRSKYSSQGVNLSNCNFLHTPHDSYWTRDYGPWFIAGEQKIEIINFVYNRPRHNDNNIPNELGSFINTNVYNMNITHCGGNYMTDGVNVAVSTNLVWEENSSKSHSEINQMMNNYLGVSQYFVKEDPLGDYIKHVDCWGKFLDVDKVMITKVPQSNSNYSKYEEVANFFANQTSAWGNKYNVYRVYSSNGQPYTNSLILNNKVFVPVTGSSNDNDAINSYKEAMPGYEVIGISGSWQTTDALHCRTHEIADIGMLRITHTPIQGEIESQNSYYIEANVKAYSGETVYSDSVRVVYKVNSGTYNSIKMTKGSGNSYHANIPSQNAGSTVSYYIHAADYSGRSENHPYIGAFDPHVFTIKSGGTNQEPIAEFTSDKTNISTGESVQFTDQSQNNPTSWKWNFEGGNPSSSTQQNPVVKYNTPGKYTVSLTATNYYGNNTETKYSYIVVGDNNQKPTANFKANKTNVSVGETVQFTDLSSNNPNSWQWTFDGGDPSSSTKQNPSVSYNKEGTYTVKLTVRNSLGSDYETKTSYIKVSNNVNSYCSSEGNDYSYEWIAGITVGSFTKNSEASGYSDFTNETINLTANNSHNITLKPGFKSDPYNEHWKVWIDFNNDGDFKDSGEEVFSKKANSDINGNISIPNVSTTTRMRIIMSYYEITSSCDNYGYGETEDYTININRERTGNVKTTHEIAVKAYPNPNNGNFQLEIKGIANNNILSIYNSSGITVYHEKLSNMEKNITTPISIPHVPTGIYFIEIKSETNAERIPIVINH